jgi:hypothetical protein
MALNIDHCLRTGPFNEHGEFGAALSVVTLIVICACVCRVFDRFLLDSLQMLPQPSGPFGNVC